MMHSVEATAPSGFFTYKQHFRTADDSEFIKSVRSRNKQAWKNSGRAHGPKTHSRIIIPHMEWSSGRFRQQPPKPLSTLQIKVSVIHPAHDEFNGGAQMDTSQIKDEATLTGIPDTGAQTCASGIEILDRLNIAEKYLIPTSHRIVGIIQSYMDIVGVLFLKIEVQNRSTLQVVYVSRSTQGF